MQFLWTSKTESSTEKIITNLKIVNQFTTKKSDIHVTIASKKLSQLQRRSVLQVCNFKFYKSQNINRKKEKCLNWSNIPCVAFWELHYLAQQVSYHSLRNQITAATLKYYVVWKVPGFATLLLKLYSWIKFLLFDCVFYMCV